MKAEFKRIINRGIALGLMALMACVNPLQTLSPSNEGAVVKAAGKDAPYVGEVRLAVDDKADKAKQILIDAGYEVVDQDLNEEAGSFWNDLGDQAVYMGIKRTDDESKAIRDMKTMNMLGKYSYSDLETRLKENRSKAKEIYIKLNTAINEYSKNYKAGDLAALEAHNLMNMYREDDSGKLIGDFFLEDNTEEQIIKLLAEGNVFNITAIGKSLSHGAEEKTDEGATWLDRISKVTSYNMIVKRYAKKMYGTENVLGEKKEQVEKAIESDLDDTARTLLANWNDIRSTFTNGKENEEEVEEFLDNESERDNAIEFSKDLANLTTIDYSKVIPYGKKTLYDLFTVPAATFRKNIKNLYPLVYALSDGQRALADTMEISDLFHAAVMRKVAKVEKKDIEKRIDEVGEKIASEGEPLSVYEGVDRDQFSENAAMTSRATANMSSTEGDDRINDMVYRYLIHSVLGVAILSAIIAVSAHYSLKYALDRVDTLYTLVYQVSANDEYWEFTSREMVIDHLERYQQQVKILPYIKWIAIGISVIAAVVSAVMYYIDQKQKYNHYQLPIPEVLVDYDVENEAGRYVTYHVVKWNKTRELQDGEKSSDRADRADLNGDAAREWLALYTTTDKAMGDPILADGITARVGNNEMPTANENGTYVPLTMFGQAGIQNLVDAAYSYNDEVGGIYLWYQKALKADGTDELIDDTDKDDQAGNSDTPSGVLKQDSGAAADVTGSNIGGGISALIGTFCAIGGFVVGILFMYFYRKKRKTQPE